MAWLDEISIRRTMILSVSMVLVFYIGFMVYSLAPLNVLGDLTATLYDHPLKASNAAIEAKAGVLRMLVGMKDVTPSTTEVELPALSRRELRMRYIITCA